jgi:hypothetical protein
MRFPLALLMTAALAPAVAVAQSPQTAPQVAVSFGPAVQARTGDLGRSELDQIGDVLAHDVRAAAERSGAPISRIDLVIQDIQPNLPTSAQLGRSAGLSPRSYSLGGAAVTGTMTVGGEARPIRFRYFQSDPANAVNFDMWGDASQAFDMLSAQIAHGQAPYDDKPWPPPHKVQNLTGTRIPG